MTKENIYRLNYACLELAEAPNIQREIVKQMSYFKLPNYISEKDAFDILKRLLNKNFLLIFLLKQLLYSNLKPFAQLIYRIKVHNLIHFHYLQ